MPPQWGTALRILPELPANAEKLLRGLLVAAALHQDVEDVIVLVDSTPERMTLALDGQKHCGHMPLVPWLGSSAPQPIGILLPPLQTPRADGLIRHVDPTGQHPLCHIAATQAATVREPAPMAASSRWASDEAWSVRWWWAGACLAAYAGVCLLREGVALGDYVMSGERRSTT